MNERLENLLRAYAESDAYAFHMPGHKRRLMPGWPAEAGAIDITEIDGFDNLHDAQEILAEEMKSAAAFYGAQETIFSVNGSTCGMLAAISAAVPEGGRILIERTSHMSVYHAAYLRKLHVSYIKEGVCAPPKEEDRNTEDEARGAEIPAEGASNGSNPDPENRRIRTESAADKELDASDEKIDAVVITSPGYEGCVRDITAWAAFAHRRGACLIVDGAHGAHLGIHTYFPESAVRQGADIVVMSTHKTLPAMTQTALIHNVTGRVSSKRLHFFMDIYETSSPSYVLMASITGALHFLYDQGEEAFSIYADRLRKIRRELSKLKNFALAGGENAVLLTDDELPPFSAGTRMDPGKLVIFTSDGNALYDVLRERYHLQMEMRAPGYVLAMTSPADTEEGFERLAVALRELDSEDHWAAPKSGSVGTKSGSASKAVSISESRVSEKCESAEDMGPAVAAGRQGMPVQKLRICEAVDAPCEVLPLREAEDRISGDFVILYPPDAPLIVPGELITKEVIEGIEMWIDRGYSVMGVDNGNISCVISEKLNPIKDSGRRKSKRKTP